MHKKAIESVVWLVGMAVILVIAVVIAIMIYDLETGNFSAFIRDITGRDNTQDLIAQCNNLVDRGAKYEYCCAKKQVTYEQGEETKRQEITCQELSTMKLGTTIQKINCNNIC